LAHQKFKLFGVRCSHTETFINTQNKILSSIRLSVLTPYVQEFIGVVSVDFDAIDQLLIIYSAFVKYLREKGNKMKQRISYAVIWTGLIWIRTGTDGGHL